MIRYRIPLIAALLLAACTAEKPVEPVNSRHALPSDVSGGFSLPTARSSENPAKTLNDYTLYENVLRAAKAGDDIQPAQFLSSQSDSAMGEAVRNEWLKSLARRGDWATFQREYAKLAAEGRSQEVGCYAENLQDTGLAAKLVRETGRKAAPP